MQFLRISLLIFAISFIFACSLGTQSYGKLSLSIEVPEYIKTEPNEQANNARFIHPNGDSLEFELYTERRVIHTQTIPLNPKSNSPQTVPISVDKVPYNVSLFAKITVYGNLAPVAGNSILGQNTIDIGKLRYPTQKLTLGVKPVSDTTVAYVGFQVSEYEDPDIELDTDDTYADTFNIEMFPKKGLYTISCNNSEHIYLYDSEGKTYPNSFLINGLEQSTRVFYHPENKASTYYAYLSSETSNLYGYKLDQDILVTQYDENDEYDEIVGSEWNIDFGYLSPSGNSSTEITFTIYNPYSYALSFTTKFKNETVTPITGGEPFESKNNFKTNSFPHSLPPGKSQKFEIIFEPEKSGSFFADFTIQAEGLGNFVLKLSGSGSGF